MKITHKFVYGGMFVDKFFLRLEDGTVEQVTERDYDTYKKDDDYPRADTGELRLEHTGGED